jgi:hypothetical protein
VQTIVPLQSQTAHARTSSLSEERTTIDQFWNELSAPDQERIEQELVKEAPPFLREQYLNGRAERGLLFQTVRQAMIDEFVRKHFREASRGLAKTA